MDEKLGVVFPFHATPASTKGASVIGRKGTLNSPYSGTPNTGMRISKLATASLLPRSRSNAGHELIPDVVPHSSWLNEP